MGFPESGRDPMSERPEIEMMPLNMEETGMLCHALLENKALQAALLSGKIDHPYTGRMAKLYVKLAKANDKLMGKTR